jgi:hypothetical protein
MHKRESFFLQSFNLHGEAASVRSSECVYVCVCERLCVCVQNHTNRTRLQSEVVCGALSGVQVFSLPPQCNVDSYGLGRVMYLLDQAGDLGVKPVLAPVRCCVCVCVVEKVSRMDKYAHGISNTTHTHTHTHTYIYIYIYISVYTHHPCAAPFSSVRVLKASKWQW